MILNEYCEYIRNPLAKAKARVVVVPPGENWTTLRRLSQERGDVELRLSDLVNESAWLPMPAEVFRRVHDAMTTQTASDKATVLLGMPGYLSLLTQANKQAAIVALRDWVDSVIGREAICFLRYDDETGLILKEVFSNPRYRQGKQLIEIDSEQVSPQLEVRRMEITLVGEDLVYLVPEACDSFQKYLRHTEEHPNDSSVRHIVVSTGGRELAGLSTEVRQVVCLRDFARNFFDVVDPRMSEEALLWMCERAKEDAGKTLPKILNALFFPESGVAKHVLRVLDEHVGKEREVVLWLVKHIAPKGSYLERIIRQEDVVNENFRSAYVSGAAQWLDMVEVYADERRNAIQEADIRMSGADIRWFINRCVGESTSRVAPWLNCGTDMERAELLRRCTVDGFVSKAVRIVYPEVAAYLNADPIFGDEILEEYFRDYRELKITGRVTSEFFKKAHQAYPPSSVQSRDTMVQRFRQDNDCALLVVDAMGAEWIPMLISLARQRNIGVDSVAIAEVHLPTSTMFNNIHWPEIDRRLPDIKRFDNIAHNGAEAHEARRAEENLAAALDVIGDEVLPRVADGLIRFERILVTADHGSSRLAVLAYQSEQRMVETIICESNAEIADWRYRTKPKQSECPSELEETLEGNYWVVRGYNRLPKKGGGQSFELHGGATLEERLVPVVIFSRTGQFMPTPTITGKRPQIVEKDDFDL